MYELVNKSDNTRMSRTKGRDSSTLFATREEEQEWGDANGCKAEEYEVREAKEG